jgi:hypothetical protein
MTRAQVSPGRGPGDPVNTSRSASRTSAARSGAPARLASKARATPRPCFVTGLCRAHYTILASSAFARATTSRPSAGYGGRSLDPQEASAQPGEIRARRSQAKALHGAGQPAAAQAELETALRLAAETGNTYQQASAHRDLAESHHRAGQEEYARHHRQQALDLYTHLGAPEADQVRSGLGRGKAGAPRP